MDCHVRLFCANCGEMARPKFHIAPSESNADMFYGCGFRAPDAVIFLERDGVTRLLLSDLEIDRARSEARVDEVESFSAMEKELQGTSKKKPAFNEVVAAWLVKHKARSVQVPADFSLGIARALREEGIRMKPTKDAFWPEREFKTTKELRAITVALRIAEVGMARGFEVLTAATIRKDGRLFAGNRCLTAELLRAEIEIAIVRAGGEARGDTIVACGEIACDPHARGRGPLRAHELIILDIFPRSTESGYFGDISRTVVRGTASDAQRHLWQTCLEGQETAIAAIRPGKKGLAIQDKVRADFAAAGYPTERRDGRWQGFFHGLGHGLGLEIHEAPRFASATFRPGQVITVEPGIYIPGLGGVRHEDVVHITRVLPTVLTRHSKPLEL